MSTTAKQPNVSQPTAAAAAQPTASEPAAARPTAAAPARRPLTRPAWILALVGLLGTLAATLYIGITIAPQEAAAGRTLLDTPDAYQLSVLIAVSSLLLWGLASLVALGLAIAALVRGERRRGPIGIILLTVCTPALGFAAFLISMLITTAQLSASL